VKFLEGLVQTRSIDLDLERAVDKALQKFGCSRAEVDVTILNPGRRGWLGFGRQPAEVQVRLVDRGYIARFLLQQLLSLSGWSAEVDVVQSSDSIGLHIRSTDVSQIIGRQGQSIEALQYLVTTLSDRLCASAPPLLLDADGYRHRRHRYLKDLARTLSARVLSSGREARVDPLPLHERRLLHQFLKDQQGVSSSSVGSGYEKQIVIAPEG